MSVKNIYRPQPSSTEGQVYKLYKALETFKPKSGKKLKKLLLLKEAGLTGVVPKGYAPEEDKTFMMLYHKTGEIFQYGVVSLPDCQNICQEDGHIYFEGKNPEEKYVLIPHRPD